MKLLICLLFLSPPAYPQWRPVVSSTITPQAINENFNRAAIWSNRKIDKYANETIRGKNTFTAGQTFSSTVTLPTRDKIIFGNELSNSSSSLTATSYTFTQTNFNLCASTLTITTQANSRIEVNFSGSNSNNTAGEFNCLNFKINGTIFSSGCAGMNTLINANQGQGISYSRMTSPLAGGTYNICLTARVSAGTGTLNVDANGGNQFWIREMR